MQQALGGGVTRSLALDAHGKCRSGVMPGMVVDGFRIVGNDLANARMAVQISEDLVSSRD